MTTTALHNEADVDAMCARLRHRKLPMTVTVVQGVNRSLAQNRLQFEWARQVSEQLGGSIEEVRAEFKLRHGIPLLRENPEFAETYDAILKPHSYEAKLTFIQRTDFPVTRLMSTEQMTRYLDSIFKEYTAQGCALTIPEEG